MQEALGGGRRLECPKDLLEDPRKFIVAYEALSKRFHEL
jgi:hypothetical protein